MIRYPWLMPVAKKAIHIKVFQPALPHHVHALQRVLSAEQTQTYARAHIRPSPSTSYRLGTGVLRVYQAIFPKLLGKFFSPSQASCACR